jgi:hypothetical protein
MMRGALDLLRMVAVVQLALAVPTLANASDWRPLNNQSWFLDVSSVRTDYYSTQLGVGFSMQPYKVAWLKFVAEDGEVLLQTLFNCHRGFEVIEQIVDTKDARYRSFDNTQAARNVLRGAQVKTIEPDSPYEVAQSRICKTP